MVTFAGDDGAVNAPLEVMAPELADHVTAEFGLPVPCTVALHCEGAPGATVVGVHEIVTEETCEETGCEGCEGCEGEDGWDCDDAGAVYPPHAAHKSNPAEARTSNTVERPENS